MQVELKYGHGLRSISIPEGVVVSLLQPAVRAGVTDLEAEVRRALKEAERIFSRPAPQTVAVAVPDATRPLPVPRLLEPILKKIFAAWPGLARERVTVIVGGGLHPPAGELELAKVASPEFAGIRVIAHDAFHAPMLDLGRTSLGTPVRVNAALASADFKVAVGQVDPHQFVGFTGGAKAAAIGCASASTIEQNHALMFRAGAEPGRLKDNPVRADLDEAGRIIGIDLALNAVLNADNQVAAVFAGKPEQVLAQAAPVCAEIYGIELADRFDGALISCGGYPKDSSLYQAQKGLNLASAAVAEGGLIAMLAECSQGVGDDRYLEYASRYSSACEAFEDFQRHPFRMGAHKSYLFGKTLSRYAVVVESELAPEILARCHLRAGKAEAAVRDFVEAAAGPVRLAVVPYANTTFFIGPKS